MPRADAIVVPVDDPEVVQNITIDRSQKLWINLVGFVRQLSEAGVIALKRSPHGRESCGRQRPLR